MLELAEPDSADDADALFDAEALAENDADADADSDATDGEAVRVEPPGATNGPMLNVARCVPSMVYSGVAEAIEGDPVGDRWPVADADALAEGDNDSIKLSDAEGDCNCNGDGAADVDTL